MTTLNPMAYLDAAERTVMRLWLHASIRAPTPRPARRRSSTPWCRTSSSCSASCGPAAAAATSSTAATATPWLDNLKRPWAATKLRAGISPTFTWHGLRHTWTTWMLRNGAPEKQIIELAGWRSGAMLETYAHLRARHLTHTAGLSLAPGERRTS